MKKIFPKRSSSQTLFRAAIVTLVVGMGFFYFLGRETSSIYREKTAISNDQQTKAPRPTSVSADSVANRVPADVPTDTEQEKPFHQWLATEEANVNDTNLDTDKKAEELKNIAAKFTVAQRKILLEKSLDAKAPMQSRILSSYLLTLTDSKEEMMAFIQSPIALRDAKHNSPEEIQNTQERSLRITQVNELLGRAANDPSVLAELQKIYSEVSDPVVKKYLQSKLNDISNGDHF